MPLCLPSSQHSRRLLAILPHSLHHRSDLEPKLVSGNPRNLAQLGLQERNREPSLRHHRQPTDRYSILGIVQGTSDGTKRREQSRTNTPQPYHLTHHKSLGVDGLDTDLPTAFEAVFLDSVAGKAFFATFQILFYALRPMMVYKLPLTQIHALNIFVQVAFDMTFVHYFGGNALWYFIMSSFLAGSLHPCAGHFIAEHYVFDRQALADKASRSFGTSTPVPETYSYYGPLNLLTYNVGLHNEHHDFPAIPWTRLPKLHEIAKEFYDDLPCHYSWVGVIWQFIWDKEVGLHCRVKRKEGGRKVGVWKEEDIQSK